MTGGITHEDYCADYSEEDRQAIRAVLHEVTAKALRRHVQAVRAHMRYMSAEEGLWIINNQADTIRAQQRIIEDLLKYIGELP